MSVLTKQEQVDEVRNHVDERVSEILRHLEEVKCLQKRNFRLLILISIACVASLFFELQNRALELDA